MTQLDFFSKWKSNYSPTDPLEIPQPSHSEGSVEWSDPNPKRSRQDETLLSNERAAYLAEKRRHYQKHRTQILAKQHQRYLERKSDPAFQEKRRRWRENSKESRAAWWKKNGARMNKWTVEYRAKKRKDDIAERIKHNLQVGIRRKIKQGWTTKIGSVSKLCGCDRRTLLSHIQGQFLPGMTWENYGQWHLDHIRPCASYNLLDQEQAKACFHYTNLRPLWAKDNISKGARWNGRNFRMGGRGTAAA